MRTRTPRKDAVSRLPKNPCQERSGGKVVKRCKGTPKNISNVRKLFEPSPTRGPTEMLSQLSKKQIKFNPTTTTASTRLGLRFCADQPGGGTLTGSRQDCQEGLQPGQDWLD